MAYAILLLFGLPSALAVWGAPGGYEPDTRQDVEGGFMFQEPPLPTAGSRLYFNVVRTALHVEPSAQYTGTSLPKDVVPPPLPFRHHLPHAGSTPLPQPLRGIVETSTGYALGFVAILGIWTDCDGDGFVGNATTGLYVYPESLLPGGSPCADSHVFEGHVHEMREPSHHLPPGARVPYIKDPDAGVWGDTGLPGEARSIQCATVPLSQGATGSMGGLLRHLDCGGHRGLITTFDALAGPGLAFGDPENPQRSRSPLNVQFPIHPYRAPDNDEGRQYGFMESSQGYPIARVWDCEPGKGIRITLVPPGITPPDPTALSLEVHPDGSLAWELDTLPRDSGCGPDEIDQFRPHWPYSYLWEVESQSSFAASPQRQTSFTFRPLRPELANGRTSTPGWSQASSPPWTDVDTGLLHRETLDPQGPRYFTFYAGLGPATLAVASPPGGAGIYGAEWCHGATTGVRGGFDCEADHWWDPAYGAQERPTNTTSGGTPLRGAVPGALYHLRDVDCYDAAGQILSDGEGGGDLFSCGAPMDPGEAPLVSRRPALGPGDPG